MQTAWVGEIPIVSMSQKKKPKPTSSPWKPNDYGHQGHWISVEKSYGMVNSRQVGNTGENILISRCGGRPWVILSVTFETLVLLIFFWTSKQIKRFLYTKYVNINKSHWLKKHKQQLVPASESSAPPACYIAVRRMHLHACLGCTWAR